MLVRLLPVLVAALLWPAAAEAAETIRFYSNGHVAGLGSWDLGKNPRLAGAVKNFGQPDVRRPAYDGIACRVIWQRLGLKMYFANFGGADPCHGQTGYAGSLVISGDNSRRWRTEAGLRTGMRSARVPALHPIAERHAHGWWLTSYGTHIGETSRVPGMVARVTGGRVSSFRASMGAAGD